MPAFSPTIGKFGDVTARGKPWTLWYKRHKKHFYIGLTIACMCLIGVSGWLYWQSRYIPAPGGTLVEGIVGFPQRLNPLFSGQNEVDADLTPLIFRGVMKYDENQELVPDLAENVERSDDGKTYTLTLGDHKWHDGQPVTANDVAFTIKLAQSEDYHGTWSGSFTGVEVSINNEKSLTLELKDAYAPFDQNLTMGILPSHLLSGKSITQIASDPFNLEPIGNGKLEFESILTNPETDTIETLSFQLHDGYIKQIQFNFYPSLDDAMTDFKLGKIHALGTTYDPEIKLLDDFDKQQREGVLKGQTYGLYFNLASDSVKDIKVRKALSHSLPKEQILNKVLSNHYDQMNGVYSKDHWATSDSYDVFAYNEAEAKNIWDETEDRPSTITLLVPDKPIHKATADQIAASWQKRGIEVSVMVKSGSEIADLVESGSGFDVVLIGEKFRPDPDRYNNWHSTQSPPIGLNISRLSNDRVDKALEDARTTFDENERKVKYATFQDYLAREAAVLWLYQPHYLYMTHYKVYGIYVGE